MWAARSRASQLPAAACCCTLGAGALLLLSPPGAACAAAAPARRRPGGQTTTASGLKITDLRIGDGPSPTLGDTVQVHYTGRLYEKHGMGVRFPPLFFDCFSTDFGLALAYFDAQEIFGAII